MLGIHAVDLSTSSSLIYHPWWTEARKFSDKRKKRSADEEKAMHCIEWREIDTVIPLVDHAVLRYTGMTTIVGGIDTCDQCIRFWGLIAHDKQAQRCTGILFYLSAFTSSSHSLAFAVL